MTVSSTTTTVSYTGNGSATEFSVTFPFKGTGTSAELTVVERIIATGVETTKVNPDDYTVTGGSGLTGTVIAGSAPASTVQWHLRRNTTATQTSDYVTNDPFPADTLEGNLDRLTMTGQERDGDISQAFKFPDTYTGGASVTFPEPVANAYVLFNAAADALTTSTTAATQYLGSDGSAAAPFYSWSGDVNSGFYRIGSDNVGLSLGGTKRVDFATAGTAITGTLTTSGIVSVDDTTDTTSGTSGSIHTDGGIGIAKKLFVGGVTTVGDDIVSDTDSTDDLGTTSVRWANLWVDAITTTANQTVGGNLTVTGNLTINGTTVTNDATNTLVKDPLIGINNGASTNASDLGMLMERGSTGDNGFMGWDESGDFFTVGTTTGTADSTGNLTYSFANFKCAAITATSGTLAGITSFGMGSGATITGGVNDTDSFSDASAVTLATSESIKAYVDSSSKAAGISMTWETATTDSDQGVGKVWANNGTLSSATVLYFDDVERNSVSINALIDSLDDPTASNSATIYIQEAGTATAGVVFNVSGAVTSASTYSKVAVTHLATFGTLSDGDVVGVTFAFSGNDGAGSGTVTQINAGDGFSFSAITGTGTIAVDGNLQDLDALGVVSSDGQMIVGTGSGAYAYESGATLRTSIGSPGLATVNTFSKAQSGSITALSDGANISVDLSANNHFSVTLGGNRTLDNPTNIVAGTSGSFFITQDGSGSRTLAYGSYYDFAGGTAPTLTTTASKVDRIDYIARTTTSLHCVFTGDLS